MHTLSIRDLTPHETHTFLSGTHERLFPSAPPITADQSLKIWDMVGGRLSFLSKVVKSHNLEESARDLVAEYKEWLHSRVGLIPDLDDDVMDEQKVSYCSFVRFGLSLSQLSLSQKLFRMADTLVRQQLLFQHFAKLAEDPKARISQAMLKKLERDEDNMESEEAIEHDLVNSLPQELDIKVNYRDAVRYRPVSCIVLY